MKAVHVLASVVLAVAIYLFIAPPPAGVPVEIMRAAALTIFAMGFWASGALPEHLTAIAFFIVAMLFSVAPPTVVFSGFASTALWLVFAGLVLGAAIKCTGLGERLARLLVGRIGSSYLAIISGIALVAVTLSFIMPSSMGRVVLLIPIVTSLAELLGFSEHSRGRTGMVMAAGLCSFVPGAAILPAAVPNMVLVGSAETQYGMHFTYVDYFVLHFPVIGVLNTLFIVGLSCLIFGEHPRASDLLKARTLLPPLKPEERRLIVVLVLTLMLWATDFIHGISPAWIGLTAAFICLLPTTKLVPPPVFRTQVDFSPFLYVAGILGMAAVVATSGFGRLLGDYLLDVAPLYPGADGINFAALVGISIITGLIGTMAGVPAIFTPLANQLADATQMSLYTVLMTQVIGYAALIIPYQSPPLVVAMQLGGVRVREALKITVLYAVLVLAILTPLNFLWWTWLGMFSGGQS